MKTVSIFGSTGSIGCNTLDVIQQNQQAFQLDTLVAGSNVDLLIEQARKFKPQHVVIADESHYQKLKSALPDTDVAAGWQAILDAADRDMDFMMSAIVGLQGLWPTMRAIEKGITIGLANKESIVCAGNLLLTAAKKHDATIIPVDSEHNAIFQLWAAGKKEEIATITLTASGGPFLHTSQSDLEKVTPEMAIKHPNWAMGAKISVDSATLANKGLEVIEAAHLFQLNEDQIKVVIHPQSIIHGTIDYIDGSTLSQMSYPDMRTPISYALAWPNRIQNGNKSLDLAAIGKFDFYAPDLGRFPCLKYAKQALKAGQGACVIFNAANEAAVALFLTRKISFLAIPRLIDQCLNEIEVAPIQNLEDIKRLDAVTRQHVGETININQVVNQ